MPVRLRITLLFTLMVFIILGIVCVFIFYFSQQSWSETMKARLANRAITTARLLSTSGLFDMKSVYCIYFVDDPLHWKISPSRLIIIS